MAQIIASRRELGSSCWTKTKRKLTFFKRKRSEWMKSWGRQFDFHSARSQLERKLERARAKASDTLERGGPIKHTKQHNTTQHNKSRNSSVFCVASNQSDARRDVAHLQRAREIPKVSPSHSESFTKRSEWINEQLRGHRKVTHKHKHKRKRKRKNMTANKNKKRAFWLNARSCVPPSWSHFAAHFRRARATKCQSSFVCVREL